MASARATVLSPRDETEDHAVRFKDLAFSLPGSRSAAADPGCLHACIRACLHACLRVQYIRRETEGDRGRQTERERERPG